MLVKDAALEPVGLASNAPCHLDVSSGMVGLSFPSVLLVSSYTKGMKVDSALLGYCRDTGMADGASSLRDLPPPLTGWFHGSWSRAAAASQ